MPTKKQTIIAFVLISGVLTNLHGASLGARAWNALIDHPGKCVIMLGCIGAAKYAHTQHIRSQSWILPVEITDSEATFADLGKGKNSNMIRIIEYNKHGNCLRLAFPRTEKVKSRVTGVSPHYQLLEQAAADRFAQTIPNYDRSNGVDFSSCSRRYYDEMLEEAATNGAGTIDIVSPKETQRLKDAENNSGTLVVGLSPLDILNDLVKAEERREYLQSNSYEIVHSSNGYFRAKRRERRMKPGGKIIVTDKSFLY